MRLLNFITKGLRFDKFYNFFFVFCFGLALLGLIFVESLGSGITQKIQNLAQKGIASDLIITSRTPITDDKKNLILNFLNKNDLEQTPWIETYSLVAQKNGNAKLAHLNFVGNLFPFYGTLELENKKTLSPRDWALLHQQDYVWIEKGLASQLNLKIGDSLKIGDFFFKINDFILMDDFSSFRAFSLAPKIFISLNHIQKTKLIQYGSTANYAYSIKVKDNQNPASLVDVKESLKKIINDKNIRVQDYKDSGEQSNRAITLLNDYLGLISLVCYMLGLLGLYYFTQYILTKKIKTIAIYKSLGLDFKFLFKVEVLQLFFLILISLLFSFTTFAIFAPSLQKHIKILSGEELALTLSLKSFIRIFLIGVLGVYLSLLPLYWASLKQEVKSILGEIQGEAPQINRLFFLPLLLYIGFLSIYLSHSFKIGFLFLGALFLLLLLSFSVLRFLLYLASRDVFKFNLINTHALKLITRYFHSSFTLFISSALGICLLVFIFQVENSLRNDLVLKNSDSRADLFLFDLQESDLEKFKKISVDHHFKTQMISPMIRARFVKVNGKKFTKDDEALYQTRESENEERFRNRGVNLSYRDRLSPSERVVQGKEFLQKCKNIEDICEISMELNYAQRLGIKLNDRLSFDVSGVEVEGIVTNFRRVKWTSFDPNFFILFSPGVLEEAPKTYLASLKVASLEEKEKIYRLISSQLPMVSLIDISEIIRKVSKIFDIMALGIKLSALLSLGMSLLVLFSVVLNHLELRKVDMKLLSFMGFSKSMLTSLFFKKFFIILFLSVILSTAVATSLSLLMLTHFLNVEYSLTLLRTLAPGLTILAILSVAILIKLKLMQSKSSKRSDF